jgi:hypothetical protein
VAAKKSAAFPYNDWPDGRWHSKPYAQHLADTRAKAGNPLTLPDPPVGTYDPAIDYNAGAAKRGWQQTQNDAQTAFEQGQQDYDLNLGDLTTGRDRTLADLLTGKTRLNEDYGIQTKELGRQYGILGRQQTEGAAQRGVTSAGLLGKSAAVRSENQGREQSGLDLARNRGLADIGTNRTRVGEDFTRGKLGLDLGNARTFGGFNGQAIVNPLTGQPEFGSLLTGVTRAGAENTAFQTAASQQRAAGAQAMGYVSPLTQPIGGVYIGNTPLTPQMWQSGMFLDALLAGSKPYKPPAPKKGRQVRIGG